MSTTTPTPPAPEAPQAEPEPQTPLQTGVLLILDPTEDLDRFIHAQLGGPPPPAPPVLPRRGGGGGPRGSFDWRRVALWAALFLLSFLLGRLVGKLGAYIDSGLPRS
jgi:hypothetical protein